MLGIAETFEQQSELINLNGIYKNEFETMKLLRTLPSSKQKEFDDLTESLLNKLHQPEDKEKCAKNSRTLREKGNSIYKSKSIKDFRNTAERLLTACDLYTQAIMAAENAKEELCLAYANRGLALQDFGYFKQAYDDHACAMEFGYPKNMEHKLIARQAHCAWKLGDAKTLEKHLNTLKTMTLNESFKEQVEQLRTQLKLLKNAPAVKQKQDSHLDQDKSHKIATEAGSRGRHMIALESISKGELIFSENAECFVPIGQRLICHNCASVMMCAPTPCPQCHQRVVYCSQSCRKLDAKVHYYECGAYRRDLVKMIGVSHLSLRLLITYLPQLLPELDGDNARELWKSLMWLAGQKNTATSSQAIQSLAMISHLGKVQREELVYHALCANLLQAYLYKCTMFYDLLNIEGSNTDWHLIIAALLLRNSGQLMVNGHVGDAIIPNPVDSTKFALLQPSLWQSPYHLRLGCLHKFSNTTLITAINLPYLSLCNHACNPSLRSKYDGFSVRNFAAENIKSGEEIFNCYTLDCKQAMYPQRQAHLEDIYKFSCRCRKCLRTDKNMDYLAFHRYRCEDTECGRIFIPQPTRSQDTLNWWMEPDVDIQIFCTVCGKLQDSLWYDEFMEQLEHCKESEGRRELYQAFEGLDMWLLDYHSLKLVLARELISACFAAREDFDWDDFDYEQLIEISKFQLAGIEEQCGNMSNEYISKLTYLLDLIAWSNFKCHAQQLQKIRKTFEYLPKETREIFVNYYNDFIEQ